MDAELFSLIKKELPTNFESLGWPVKRDLLHKAKLKVMRERREMFERPSTKTDIGNVNKAPIINPPGAIVQRIVSSGIDKSHRYVFVAFFTVDTGYEKESQNLIASLDALGLPYYIEGIRSLGTWTMNTQYKPILIKKALDMFRRPVVCIDVDAVIRRNPDLFDHLKADFAAYIANSTKRLDAELFPEIDGNTVMDMLLSGTIWFNDTPGARKLLERWQLRCKSEPGVIDQTLLLECVKGMVGEISIHPLPVSYCQIYDIVRDRCPDPVIEHYQASRRHRGSIRSRDSQQKTIAILVPTRKRPKELERLVGSSCNAAAYPERVLFYFLISSDDSGALEMVGKLRDSGRRIIVVEEPRDRVLPVNLSMFWNMLYRTASEGEGHYCYGFFGDDVEFRTNNWDSMVVEEFKKHQRVPWMIRVNESGNNPRKSSTLFFTNGLLHKEIGFYMPEQYVQTYMDTWWDEICQGAGCFTFLRHIVTFHHSIILKRAPVDENYMEKLPTREAVITADHELFYSSEEVRLRKDIVERLKKCMVP